MTNAAEATAREIAEVLLRVGAVILNAKDLFTYASGARSPIYCDNRLLMSYPEERRLVVGKLADALAGSDLDVVAGTATAGIPWAAWVADRLGRPMVYVRDAPKGHGRQQRVEGIITPGQRVVVLEDLVTTGGSALSSVEGLREVGATVSGTTTIFSYESPKAAQAFRAAGVQLTELSGIATLLDVATSTGRISAADAEEVRRWHTSLG